MISQLALLGNSFSDFLNEWFSPEMGEYEYIGISGTTLRNMIFGLLIGFFLACCITVFDRRVLGDFVRHVLQNECLSKDRAKTLAELGYLKNTFIRGSLKSGVTLRRVVKCVEEEEFLEAARKRRAELEAAFAAEGKKPPKQKPEAFKIDVSVMHFYIPEEMKYMAEVKFEKKGANWVTLLIALLLFIAIAALVIFLLPDLLQMLDNMLGQFDPKNDILT